MTLFRQALPPEKKASFRKDTAWAAALALFLYGLDQGTKELVVRLISQEMIHVIPGFFDLTHVRNLGAAFGIFRGYRFLLLAISFAALVLIILFFRKLTEGWKERIYALSLIISGILGNCTDRIFRGNVVDFLRFYIGKYEWPSFNVADSCICIGVALFVISTLFRPEQPSAETK